MPDGKAATALRLALATICSFAATALSGCGSGDRTARYDVDAKNILGEWRFVRYEAGAGSAAPPRFDVIEFSDDQAMRLKDSMGVDRFAGSFDLVEQAATLTFEAPDQDEPVELVFGLGLLRQANGNEMLVLVSGRTRAVYLRSEQFLEDDLSGLWISEGDDPSGVVVLTENGLFGIPGEGIRGLYRLWESPFGKTMTSILSARDLDGVFVVIDVYEDGEDTLTLTGVGPDGPDPNMKQEWTRFRLADQDYATTAPLRKDGNVGIGTQVLPTPTAHPGFTPYTDPIPRATQAVPGVGEEGNVEIGAQDLPEPAAPPGFIPYEDRKSRKMQAAPGWVEVFETSGGGSKNTETFEITSMEWRVRWLASHERGGGKFIVQAKKIDVTAPSTPADELIGIAVANVIYPPDFDPDRPALGAASGKPILRGAGRYYLEINSLFQKYTILVEQR